MRCCVQIADHRRRLFERPRRVGFERLRMAIALMLSRVSLPSIVGPHGRADTTFVVVSRHTGAASAARVPAHRSLPPLTAVRG